MKKYQIIYADPPWSYRGQNQNGFKGDVGYDSGGALHHYKTMSVQELISLPVADICDKDCLLFLWITSPCLKDGMRVAEGWGFKWATIAFIWDKQKTNPSYYTLSNFECCFVFKKGKIPQPRGTRNERQFLSSHRTKHSEKPAEIRKRIERMFPSQKKRELFARQKTEGWDVWGNEVTNDIELTCVSR